ncbi:MAG: 3-oxoacyl-[acyl-carrier protein] reductase, partial [uncultured Thermomicrobiales bacterium]
ERGSGSDGAARPAASLGPGLWAIGWPERPRHWQHPRAGANDGRMACPRRRQHHRHRARAGCRRCLGRRDRGHWRSGLGHPCRSFPPRRGASACHHRAGDRRPARYPRQQCRHEHLPAVLGSLRRRLGRGNDDQRAGAVHPQPACRATHDGALDPGPDRQRQHDRRLRRAPRQDGLQHRQGRGAGDDPQYGLRACAARHHRQLRRARRGSRSPRQRLWLRTLRGRPVRTGDPRRALRTGRGCRRRRDLLLPAGDGVDNGADAPDRRRPPLLPAGL